MAQPEFPVPDYRFDQKNEMFKRAIWDPAFETVILRRFYGDVVYQDKPGWRKPDFAARNAAWNVEWGFGMGNSRGNSGLYAWEGIQTSAERFVKAGGKVENSPERMSRLVKATALRLGARARAHEQGRVQAGEHAARFEQRLQRWNDVIGKPVA